MIIYIEISLGGKPKEIYYIMFFNIFIKIQNLQKKINNYLLKFENPIDYDKEKRTPLHFAVRYNQNKAVKFAQQIVQSNFHLLAGQQGLSLIHQLFQKKKKISLFTENIVRILPRKFAQQSPVNLKITKYENQQASKFLLDLDEDESTQANKIQNLNVSQESIEQGEANNVLITRPKISLTYHVQLTQFNPNYLKFERFNENTLTNIFQETMYLIDIHNFIKLIKKQNFNQVYVLEQELQISILLLLSLSNDRFPIKHILKLVKQLNVTILNQEKFSIENKFEQQSRKLKKDLIYAIQNIEQN